MLISFLHLSPESTLHWVNTQRSFLPGLWPTFSAEFYLSVSCFHFWTFKVPFEVATLHFPSFSLCTHCFFSSLLPMGTGRTRILGKGHFSSFQKWRLVPSSSTFLIPSPCRFYFWKEFNSLEYTSLSLEYTSQFLWRHYRLMLRENSRRSQVIGRDGRSPLLLRSSMSVKNNEWMNVGGDRVPLRGKAKTGQKEKSTLISYPLNFSEAQRVSVRIRIK